MEKPLIEKKRLAPLNDAGPTQLLNVQIQKLEQENSALKLRIKTVEGQATEILESKLGLKMELETLRKKIEEEKPTVVVEDNSEELAKLNEKVAAATEELIAEKELSEKSQKELESDLASAKHRFLEVQHQLSMAEKVSECFELHLFFQMISNPRSWRRDLVRQGLTKT